MRLGTAGSLALAFATAWAAGCEAPPPPVRTVTDLAADPVVLQGLVSRCAADPGLARADIECERARQAMERLAAQDAANRASERAAEFERQRTLRREREERARQAADRRGTGFDPYSSPVVVEPATAAVAPDAPSTAPVAPPR